MENHLWLVFVALGLLVLYLLGRIARSVHGTEAMMRRWLAHQGVDWETPAEPSRRVRALAASTATQIAAIKAYREETGLGLTEAKAIVDALSKQSRAAG